MPYYIPTYGKGGGDTSPTKPRPCCHAICDVGAVLTFCRVNKAWTTCLNKNINKK